MAYVRTGRRNFVIKNASAANEALYQRAVAIVRREKRVSLEFLSKRLGMDFGKARGLVQRLMSEKVIGEPDARGMREVFPA